MASFPFPYENYPNPNPNYSLLPPIIDPPSSFDFELSDYLMLGDDVDQASSSQSFASSEKITGDSGGGNGGGADTGSTAAVSSNTNTTIKLSKNGVKKNKGKMGQRVAFRTKSEMEIIDDGYKWRKYGKKSVKNSPNPRNYYKCSTEGCNVKKRVEREKEDPSYVITTYEGIHNHESPFIISYNHIPPTQLIDQFLL